MCAGLYMLRDASFYHFSFSIWHLLLIIPALYVAGISTIWMHNASHGSFKNPVINRMCGEIAGVHQLWGFFGWQFIHTVHHMYSDREVGDPHNPKGKTFWQFTKNMFLHSSNEITRRYRDHWGSTTRTFILRQCVYLTFTGMVLAHLVFWFLLLGPEGFIFFYIPSIVANHIFYAHINYYCHPVNTETGNTAPANLDGNWYYKLCNTLFYGIYYHDNHHRKPKVFDPRTVPARSR